MKKFALGFFTTASFLIFLLNVWVYAGQISGGHIKSIPNPTPNFYANDYAGILNYDTVDYIGEINELLYEHFDTQIVVVTVDSIDYNAYKDIADFSVSLYNGWSIGSPPGYGALLLFSVADDDYYLTIGVSFEEYFTLTVLRDILDNYVEPEFAAGNYDLAMKNGFDKIVEHTYDFYSSDVYCGRIKLLGRALVHPGEDIVYLPLCDVLKHEAEFNIKNGSIYSKKKSFIFDGILYVDISLFDNMSLLKVEYDKEQNRVNICLFNAMK